MIKKCRHNILCNIVVILVCVVCIAVPVIADADWSAADENLEFYTQKYGSIAAANYKRISYGAKNDTIQKIKEQLQALGFFDNRVDQNFGRTLEKASRVFCQQMRIGGGGMEITALMQAMLTDSRSMPQAISPGINIYSYSLYGDQSAYTPYTYARLTRSNVRSQAQVGFAGRVDAVENVGSVQYIMLRMEDNKDNIIYIVYQPLPRTTRFQAGDRVAVFGVTQGLQSFSYTGMTKERLVVKADRIGYVQ